MKKLTLITIGLCGLLAGSTPALMAQAPDAVDQSGLQSLPEEIVVNLPQSLGRLRREVYKAENKVFDIFNEMNADPQFHVRCEMENRSGTKMKVRVCKPNYYRYAMEEEAESLIRKFENFTTFGNTPSAPTVRGQMFHLPTPNIQGQTGLGLGAIPEKNRQMESLIKTALEVSPEFVRALEEHKYIRDAYDDRHDEMRGD